VVVDKGHQAPENILKGPVVGIGGLQSALGYFQLEESVKVVVPEVLYHIILQVQFPVNILHLVYLQS